MALPKPVFPPPLAERYLATRHLSVELTAPLAAEDQVVQTMPDVSPTKWHLAHVTWFFEHFLLQQHLPDYRCWNEAWHYLFNSYYYTVGQMHARPERGLLSRPTVREIHAYREHVDAAMTRLIERRGDDPAIAFLVTLGLNHEQQHQELLLADIKHVLGHNPLGPAYDPSLPAPPVPDRQPAGWLTGTHGAVTIGADPEAGFCFDNETPRHEVSLAAHRIAASPVTNREFREFIDDGGYREPALWLADGWGTVLEQGWNRPLHWSEDLTREFTLGGWRSIDPDAPVCHVSFYEADAFARWAGARLPSEAEWEAAAAERPVAGNMLDSGYLQPVAAALVAGGEHFYGDVWEWTASPYTAYPGFRPLAGSLGEYNGKFMCNQITVRGGSCLTPADHLRASYRSFFYPHQRWQCLGFRLARDD